MTVVEAVIAMFLADGKDHTAQEVADFIGEPVRKVRAALRDIPPGIYWEEDYRPSYSTNYRMMQSGLHRVGVYGPTRETLRQRLLAQSGEGA